MLYVPGYSNLSKFYEKYRINKGVIRPWEVKDDSWPAKKYKLFTYLGINYCLVYPLLIIVSTKISGIKVRFEDFPTVYLFHYARFEVVWQLIFVAFVEDAFFYWAHRFAHESKFMYKYHKIHHEFNEVFSLATEYFHPLDYIIGTLIPSAMPFIFLGGRAHCFMFFFWQVWKIFVST